MAAKLRWTAVLVGLFAAGSIGCLPAAKPPVVDKHDDHKHVHPGPHKGHIFEIGDEEYHGEWTHDEDSGKVTVYLLGKDEKTDVAVAADQKPTITIKTIAKDKSETVQSYDLAPVNASEGDMPKTSQFEIVDKVLMGSLETMGKTVQAHLKVTIDGKEFNASMEEHEHHHH